jgi:arylsulfatase A-like enzyme
MDVLVILVDALRADALEIKRADGSPLRLRERFSTWLWFEHCYASAPWTYPAVTSLLTGADAVRHKRWKHAHALAYASLVAAAPNLWRVAVVNNPVVGGASGLDAGFDEFHEIAEPDEFWERSREVLEGRAANRVPYLAWLHSNVVHDFNLPRSRAHFERHIGPADAGGYFDIGWRVQMWQDITAVQRPAVRRVYDACVLELDERVDALLDVIDLDRTVVIFTADHGEGFDPDAVRIHHGGRMHDDLLRVPCVMHVPQSVPAEVRAALEEASSRPIGAIDLLPTVLDLVGTPVEAPDGQSLIRGATQGEGRRVLRAEDGRYLYLANRLRLNTNVKGKNMSRLAIRSNRMLHATLARTHSVRAYIDDPYKLIVTELEGRAGWMTRAASWPLTRLHIGTPAVAVDGKQWFGVELFDRDADPDEADNLLHSRAEALAALELAAAYDAGDTARSLEALLAHAGEPEPSSVKLAS